MANTAGRDTHTARHARRGTPSRPAHRQGRVDLQCSGHEQVQCGQCNRRSNWLLWPTHWSYMASASVTVAALTDCCGQHRSLSTRMTPSPSPCRRVTGTAAWTTKSPPRPPSTTLVAWVSLNILHTQVYVYQTRSVFDDIGGMKKFEWMVHTPLVSHI